MADDFNIYRDGQMIGIDAKTEDAVDWLKANVESNGYQFLGEVLWIDHRYVADIMRGMDNDGFTYGCL